MGGSCKLVSDFPLSDLINRHRFVATEEGILDFPVNIDERKTFPSIECL